MQYGPNVKCILDEGGLCKVLLRLGFLMIANGTCFSVVFVLINTSIADKPCKGSVNSHNHSVTAFL